MTLKTFKKVALAALVVCMALLAAFFPGCSVKTRHPTAKITIEFDDTEYVITYRLYRNMYPQTVQHFIELADSGFYDDTIIHDYTSTDWYGGGYSYDAEVVEDNDEKYRTDYEEDYAEAAYYEDNSLELAYKDLFATGAITPTVFKPGTIADKEHCTFENALSTLYGETQDNGHTIENGALTSEYGALRMYYTPKTCTDKVTVVTGGKQYLSYADYKNNSATSLFAIQTSTSSALASSSYCIFGRLKNDDAVETLESLQEAIADYISANYDETADFTTTVDVRVDNYEEISDVDMGQEMTYTVTTKPIIIRSVRITSY